LRLERGWVGLKLQGPFEFSLTGTVLSVLELSVLELSVLGPLAVAEVGIFALSTFDTDYVLVKAADLEGSIVALEAVGHRVSRAV
jgi:uncharacterized protein